MVNERPEYPEDNAEQGQDPRRGPGWGQHSGAAYPGHGQPYPPQDQTSPHRGWTPPASPYGSYDQRDGSRAGQAYGQDSTYGQDPTQAGPGYQSDPTRANPVYSPSEVYPALHQTPQSPQTPQTQAWGGGQGGYPPAGVWAGYQPGGWQPQGPQQGSAKKRRQGTIAAATTAALLVAGIGILIGRFAWADGNSGTHKSAFGNNPVSGSSGSGSSSSGNSSSGSNGSTLNPYGNSGSGSSGSGSSGSGSTYNPYGGSSGNSTDPFGSGGSSSNPFGSGGSFGNYSNDTGHTSTKATGSPSNTSAIAAKVTPGLVDIDTNLKYQDGEAAGTGMVLTSSGLILTNNHVINGATSIKVTDLGNDKTYTAKVVGYDRTKDVAIIQAVNASGLKTVNLGDSSKVTVSQPVVAIGNAGGVGGTPSIAGGKVTALTQSIKASDEDGGFSERLYGLIETNAGIEPGDSGGPMVTTSGQVVGMDTAALSGTVQTQSTSDQGYAIPINEAVSLAHQIVNSQSSSTVHIGETGFIGVEISTQSSSSSGAQIAAVVSGTPAATAGLAEGDTITSVGGKTVSSATSLTNLLLQYHPGDKVSVGFTNGQGQSETTTVTLANGPAQ